MKIKKTLICLALALLLIPLQMAQTAISGDLDFRGLSIKPAGQPYSNMDRKWLVYELDLGSEVEDAVEVINNTNVSKEIYIYPADSTQSSGGGFALKQKVEEMTGIGNWVILEKNELVLGPQESTTVKFTLKVPQDNSLEIGEHSGAILIQEKPQMVDDGSGEGGIMLTTRVGARIYVTLPGEIVKKVNFLSFGVQPTKYKAYPIPYIGIHLAKFFKIPKIYSISTGFKNEGNVSNDISIKVGVKDELFDKHNETMQSAQKVGRNTEAMINLEWQAPFFGKYSIKSEGQYMTVDGEGTFESSAITFWVVPWDAITGVGFLLFALIIISITGRIKNSTKRWINYKIKKTDTLKGLSEERKIKWQKIVKANKLKPPYELKPNTTILLPPKKKNTKKKTSVKR